MTTRCVSPYIDRDGLQFPCGRCYPCRLRRSSGWSFRLLKEDATSASSFFLTLTYDTSKVPITPRGFMTLCKRDVQLFMKRLRKAHGKGHAKISYYIAGEYGGRTKRPHYHMIIFNARLDVLIGQKMALAVERGMVELDGKQQFECTSWNNGWIGVGKVEGASVGYTLKYMMKKPIIPQHKNDDRVKEFQLQSKGIGKSYLTENIRQYHHADVANRMYCTTKDGVRLSMPRYYRDKLYSKEDKRLIGDALSDRMKNNLTVGQQVALKSDSDRKMLRNIGKDKL